MTELKIPSYIRLGLRIILYYAGILLFTIILLFGCFYLFMDHRHLAEWFTSLNDCFYKSDGWERDFFTYGIKSDGNMYSIIAMLLSVVGIGTLLKALKNMYRGLDKEMVVYADKGDIVPVFICLASTVASWLWGNSQASPAFDEVFSAQNAAGIHPFQGLAYYMLPNNHLFFNFLNNILFPAAYDKVFTGRILSLLAYIAFVQVVYFWFKQQFKNRWLALLFGLALSYQFLIWGFSFQARGYELYLLAEWGLFLSLSGYLLSGRNKWLYINSISIVVGYFCMPSFLYFHAAQLLFMPLYQLIYKKKDSLFWKHQIVAILATYLCYLPTLCFSGLESIINNHYVLPMESVKTVPELWEHMFPTFVDFIHHIFSEVNAGSFNIDTILYLLPLLLLISGRKNKANLVFGLFYVCLWLVFIVMVSAMKRFPFERNLIGHYSITLAALFWLVYWLFSLIKQKSVKLLMTRLMYPAFLVLFAFHFISTNDAYLVNTLYELDINKVYKEKSQWLEQIPAGSTLSCSDAEFYSYYICKKNGYKVNKCRNGKEEYYVKQNYEELPGDMEDKYVLFIETNGNQIYRRL